MAASKVPKFGAWEEGENYTVYFDKARKTKNNGQILTPNDPEYYYEMFQQNGGSAQAPRADSKGQKTKAPEFGAWGNEDNEDNVGYTAYFDNPRKSKNGGPTASENEPKMNRDINPHKDPPAQARPQPQVRSKVPHFGAWEDGGEVGYTQSFENVKRNNKNGRTVNPEPSDAPKLNRDVSEPPSKEGRSKVPQFGDWKGGEDGQYTTVFDNARKNKNAGPVLDQVEPHFNRDVSDRARPPTAGGHLRNASKGSTASETSRNGRQHPGVQSPYHQKGAKLQQRPPAGRGNQNTEKAAAVPAWGVWNTDPQQADGFTDAFRRAKEERNTPLNPNIPARYHQQSPKQKPKRKEGCCFGLF